MNMPLRIPVREKAQQPSWPSTVLSFAQANELSGFLDPLLESARTIFSTARQIDVYVGHDIEAADDAHIVFDVRTPFQSHIDMHEGRKQWHESLMRIAGPAACRFQLVLDLVNP